MFLFAICLFHHVDRFRRFGGIPDESFSRNVTVAKRARGSPQCHFEIGKFDIACPAVAALDKQFPVELRHMFMNSISCIELYKRF